MAAHPIAFAPSEVIDPALLSGTMTARRHAPSHRSTILAMVRRMIAEDGCDGIRMRRLAERSNVTPPTIYAVVGGKHDVLHAALQEGLAAKFAIAEQHAAGQNVNPIIAFAEVKWHAIATDPSYYRQIARASMGGRLDLSTVRAIHGAIADQFRRWFGMMERDGRCGSRPASPSTPSRPCLPASSRFRSRAGPMGRCPCPGCARTSPRRSPCPSTGLSRQRKLNACPRGSIAWLKGRRKRLVQPKTVDIQIFKRGAHPPSSC